MKEKIYQQPNVFKYDPQLKFPWLDLNQREFNEKYAYVPFVLSGYFDHSQEVLVKTPRLGNFNFLKNIMHINYQFLLKHI